MTSTRKRKRAMSQVNGKRGDGKGTTKAELPVNLITPDSRCPPTKKSRRQHPQRTQLPAFPAPLLLYHPALSLYFPKLLLLHSFLQQALSFLSKSSSLRKLEEIGKGTDTKLAFLLKTTVVGLKELRVPNTVLDIEDATQSTGGSRQMNSSQSEIVDLTLHTLFHRSLSANRSNSAVYPGKPNNILAQGYSLNSYRLSVQGFNAGPLGIDIVNLYPNAHVGTLKSPVWGRLLDVVGDEVMLDLLLNTSIFIQLDSDQVDVTKANYYQLAGPSLSDSLNNPAPTTKAFVVAAPGTRSAGAPLKRPLSEIEGESAKLIDKKIKPNRPATYLTNRNNVNRNDKKIPGDLLHSNKQKSQKVNATVTRDLRTPGQIIFVRSRMFYSKPAYNGRGGVEFGLRHIHVLNRFPDASAKSHTVHILKYIFPRQFNLHNAFTSIIDRKETVQPLKDYTLREEIIALNSKKPGSADDIPKRLRGITFDLVARMQRLHKRCSYHALVKYYCPVVLCDGMRDKHISTHTSKPSSGSSGLATQDRGNFPSSKTISTDPAYTSSDSVVKQDETFTDFASTPGEVSAFARAVIGNVIPRDFWGKGSGGEENRKVIMDNVDQFIKLRRYESISLHGVMQGLKLTEFHWLCPPSMTSTSKLSSSDTLKRHQLLSEFIFWLFDSFLIPLLRSHFYITESGVQRNRIFYFRHDAWRKISEPALSKLKNTVFQELKPERAKEILDKRDLGFAHIRLLPKQNGVRPVMNLRRRTLKPDKRLTDKVSLAPSINAILTPVYNVLSFEKSRKPQKMGSSISSTGEIYVKLKAFQAHLKEKGWTGRKLYFVKVDIKSCFDTIPQNKLIKIIETIVTEEEYRIEKHVRIRPPSTIASTKRPVKRYLAKANQVDEFKRFEDFSRSEVERVGRKMTIFVDDVVHLFKEADRLLDLLEEHVRRNIIRIGKKYFRQKSGIPQGSVISSILCNFFYGDLENNKLSFALGEDGILLRLVDDFLYITLDREKAEKFLTVMHEGHPEYGAFVGVNKTLVNFETSVGGVKVNRLIGTSDFPYCGNLVNTKSLDIKKDRGGKSQTNINDCLTVEYSKGAGRALHRKAVGAFKMQSPSMYFDTDFNSFSTVLKNIYHNFIEAAMRFHRAVKALPKQPGTLLLIRIVSDLLELSFSMLRKNSSGNFRCTVKRSQVRWLGAQAFKKILGKKQTNYRELLEWLDNILGKEEAGGIAARVSCLGTDPFQSFKY